MTDELMDMVHVLSTVIRTVGYDPSCSVLRVVLCGGRTYDYFNVPQRVFTWLLHADSKGDFYIRYIRDVYRYTAL